MLPSGSRNEATRLPSPRSRTRRRGTTPAAPSAPQRTRSRPVTRNVGEMPPPSGLGPWPFQHRKVDVSQVCPRGGHGWHRGGPSRTGSPAWSCRNRPGAGVREKKKRIRQTYGFRSFMEETSSERSLHPGAGSRRSIGRIRQSRWCSSLRPPVQGREPPRTPCAHPYKAEHRRAHPAPARTRLRTAAHTLRPPAQGRGPRCTPFARQYKAEDRGAHPSPASTRLEHRGPAPFARQYKAEERSAHLPSAGTRPRTAARTFARRYKAEDRGAHPSPAGTRLRPPRTPCARRYTRLRTAVHTLRPPVQG